MSNSSPTTTMVDDSETLTSAGSKAMMVLGLFTIGALALVALEVATQSRKDIRTLASLKRSRLQNCIYVLSKSTTFTYLVLLLLFQTAPLGSCTHILNATSCLYIISNLFTAVLFYPRIRAMYTSRGDWYIVPLYSLLWSGAVACCVTPLVGHGLSGVNVGTSKQCSITPAIKGYVGTAIIGPLFNTCFVFILIAFRRVQKCQVDFKASGGVGRFVAVDCSAVLSRGLVTGGQGLLLASILVQLISLILFYLGGSVAARTALIPINLAMLNIAACRVFILAQLRRLEDETERRAKIMRALSVQNLQDSSMSTLGGITITKTVETFP